MQNNLIGQRITQIRGKLSKAAFARELGVEPAYIGMLESGKGLPGKTLTELMCLKFNINKDWLLTGEGPMRREKVPSMIAEETAIYNNVRKLDVFTLAGAGSPKDLTEYESIDTIWIPASFVWPSIVPVKVRGDSMYPMIRDGAIVGVDREDRQIISGEIYAIWLPYEGAVIRRLFMGMDRVEMRADNPIFPTSLILLKELEEHFIQGRVKWIIQRI